MTGAKALPNYLNWGDDMATRDTRMHRRRVRELEAKRDKLMDQAEKTKTMLAATRAELKTVRRRK